MLYKTRLIRIGNSRGVRIPYQVIQQLELEGDVELVVEEDHLIIKAAQPKRLGWEDAFRKMGQLGDDKLLDADVGTAFDDQEWTW